MIPDDPRRFAANRPADPLDEARRAFEQDVASIDREVDADALPTAPEPVVQPSSRPARSTEAPPKVAERIDRPRRNRESRSEQQADPLATELPTGDATRRRKRRGSKTRDELPAPPALARQRPTRKRHRGPKTYREPRRRTPEGQHGFWTIRKITWSMAILAAATGWALATTFYSNATGQWRTGIEEVIDDAAAIRGRMALRGWLFSRVGHSLWDFLYNAVAQVPNVVRVTKWAVVNVPWLIVAVMSVEVLVVLFWRASRRIERKWAKIDEML